MHTSSMRYGPVLGGARDRMLPSSEVRVRYFDPRTGEPCDEKPEPLGTDRIAERIAARDAWAERDGLHRAAVDEAAAVRAAAAARTARKGGRRPRPVVVDGVTHPSVNAAARAMGCAPSRLSKKLNEGAVEHMGHSVMYEEDR